MCPKTYRVTLTDEQRQTLGGQSTSRRRFAERGGTASPFLLCAPLLGWRHVGVTERRTCLDFAQVVRALVDERFPDAERVVLDNLNAHTPASLYRAFPPAEARRLAARIEWHYAPKHGSWLNMAEIELSALARQCLNRNQGAESVVSFHLAYQALLTME